LQQTITSTVCIMLVGLAGGVVTACSPQAEPTNESCLAAVGQARSLAAALPTGDLSRYFAERDLHQAMIEAGNGEFDVCLEYAARATEEVQERRHTLQPGETLKIRRVDQ
jgi:hypothetical protein